MRRAFEKILYESAEKDDRVIFLTGDLGFQVFDRFSARFPERYINVGVAEAQLMSAAAGLAAEGYRPFAYSIASFATARPFEQIRVGISYPRLPVVVVGAGGGFTYANSGVTHHAADDLALMSMLPNMTVVSPGSPEELRQLMPQLLKIEGPAYLRIGKFGEKNYSAFSDAVLGKARTLSKGTHVSILCTGDVAVEVANAVGILNRKGLTPHAYQFHTVKPIDRERLQYLSQNSRHWVVVEEHIPNGGLFSAVAQWAAQNPCHVEIHRHGAPDRFILGSPKRELLRQRLGIDTNSIATHCEQLFNSHP